MISHRRYRGSTGSGKTNAACVHLLEKAIRGDCWITAAFPHPQWGELLIAELYATLGDALFDRLIVERLEDTDRVIMRQFIHSSDHADPYKKMLEDDEYRNGFLDICMRQQGITTLSESPAKFKYSHVAVSLKQCQDVWWSDSLLPYAIRKHPFRSFAKAHATDPKSVFEVEEIERMPIAQQLTMVESAARLTSDVLSSPVIQARTCLPETIDWTAFKNNCGIHIILGGNISDHALRVHIGTDFQKTVNDAKKRKIIPGIYFVDEATNYHLYGAYESKALSTVRAFGISMWHAVQSCDYPTPDISRNTNQNVEDYIFAQFDPDESEQAARGLKGAYDRMKIHHEREVKRQVPIQGAFDIVTRKSVAKGDNGKSVTESEQLVQRYDTEREYIPEFEKGKDQEFWKAQELQMLRVGQCVVRERNRPPYRLDVPLFPDSWGFPGYAKDKAEQCIQILKSRPPYETPVSVEFPTMPKEKRGMQK